MSGSGDEELLAELRRSLSGDSPLPDPEPSTAEQTDGPQPQDRPAGRPVSTAAMAIADQIMGLEAVLSSDGDERVRVLTLRGPAGTVVRVDNACVLGRGADAGLAIGDGRASRAHAEVSIAGGRYVVRDLGSSNGTFLVRGGATQRIGLEPVEIEAGDRLETVDHLLLAEVVEDAG